MFGAGAHALVRAGSVLVALVSAPLLARYLGPDGYGQYTTVLVVYSLLLTSGDGGLSLLVGREWPTLAAERRRGWLVDFWRLRVLVALAVTAAGGVAALAGGWPSGIRAGLLVALMALPVALCGGSAVALFAAELRPGLAAGVELLSRAGWLVGLVLVIAAGGGIVGCVAAFVVSQALAAAGAMALVRRRLPSDGGAPGTGVARMARSAALLALLPLVGLVYARADTLVLATRVPMDEVAAYGLSYRLVEALQVVAAVVVGLLVPLMVRAGTSGAGRVYSRGLELLGWVFFPAAAVLATASREVLGLLGGDAFLEVGTGGARPEHALALLMAALVLMIVGMANGAVLIAFNRERALLVAFALCIPLNLLLAAWWSGTHSFVGAAAATLVTEALGLAWTTWHVRSTLGPAGLRVAVGWPLAAALGVAATMVAAAALPLPFRLLVVAAVAVVVLALSPMRARLLRSVDGWAPPPGTGGRWLRAVQAHARFRMGSGQPTDESSEWLLRSTASSRPFLWVGGPAATAAAVPWLRRRRASVFVAGAVRHRIGHTRFGDPCCLPWPSGTFAAVACRVEALEEATARIGAAKCLAELARMVGPEGRVVLAGSPEARLWEAVPGPTLTPEAAPAFPGPGPERGVVLRPLPVGSATPGAEPSVNLACGEDRRPGWIDVDLRPVGDVVAAVEVLPFKTGSVARLRAQDILEHFWRDDHARLLEEWRRVLAPGGSLELRVPNLVHLADLVSRGQLVEKVVENLYGGHRFGPAGALDTHHWGWTPATIERDLLAAGFRMLDNDGQANMAVRAVPACRDSTCS